MTGNRGRVLAASSPPTDGQTLLTVSLENLKVFGNTGDDAIISVGRSTKMII